MIYFNNAATTWPKPEVVYETVDKCFRGMESPMRSASESSLHDDVMTKSRDAMASFFGIEAPKQLVLTPGCTYALNLAILGIDWRQDDVILMSGLEHHAVSRPVRKVATEHGVRFEVAPYTPEQPIDLDFVERTLKRGRVRLVACTMASNVSGDTLPVADVIKIAQRYEVYTLIDCAQSAGVLDVNVAKLGADMVAFAGHKGLYGPPGIGGLYVAPGVDLRTLAEGGTGGDSGTHPLAHKLPNSYEVGTHNLPAIAGLAAGIKWVEGIGIENIRKHERSLVKKFIDGVSEIPGVTVYGSKDVEKRAGAVSITMDGISPKALARWLSTEHQVTTRAGFHCAPLAHETIGTCPGEGTTRFGFGFFNTLDEVCLVVDHLVHAPRTVSV